MESIGVESIGVVGVVGVRTPKKSAHNTEIGVEGEKEMGIMGWLGPKT